MVSALEHYQQYPDAGAYHGRKQDNDGQGLLSNPGAYCRKEFEITVPHALLAGDQFEKMIN